ncbi:glycosyltransferase [Bacteroidota bacterium]
MSNPRIQYVTVLLPTYNLAEYLKYAIKSILNQSFRKFELLIVDDGSTDNTVDIVKSFNDSRIVYLQKAHTGLSNTMNYGLRKARYDWIAIMEADDIAFPTRLEKEIDFMNKNPEFSVVSCWYAVFKNSRISYIVPTPNSHNKIIHQLALHSPICNQGVIYNKREIVALGGYDNNLREYDLWLRIKDDVKYYNIPELLMLVRFREDSLTNHSVTEHKRIVYLSQSPFYKIGLDKEFGLNSESKQIEIKAWREWFYGHKSKARNYWIKKPLILLKPKIILGYILSFLPNKYLVLVQRLNLRYRIKYIFTDRNLKRKLKYVITKVYD